MSHSFWRLFGIQFLGSFVDNFIKSLLVVFVVYQNVTIWGLDETLLVPLSGFLIVVPFFLFSTLAGSVATKFERSQLITYVKAFELALVLLALWLFQIQCWSGLLVIVFFQGLQSTFFGPIKYSIIPEYVSFEHLLKANGWVEMGTFMAILLGTILGTRSIAFVSNLPWFFYGLLVLPSLIGLLLSLKLGKVNIENPSGKISFRLISSTLKEMKVFFHHKDIFKDIQAISIFWFNGIWVLSLIPLLTKQVWMAPEVLLTFFLSLITIGIGVGSILCYRFCYQFQATTHANQWASKIITLLVGTYILLGFFNDHFTAFTTLTAWILHPIHMGIILLLFFASFFMGLYVIPFYTRLQLDAPLKLRSKAIANNNIYNAFYMTLSTLIFIFLTTFLPIHAFFWVLAGINALFLLILWRKP